MDITRVLPSECISNIISFTSPKDASRSSLVSSDFKEAADSDAAWERFLPSDCKDIVAQSLSPNLNSLLTKQLYLHISEHPVLLANGHMTFSLDKECGKKCYMVGAKGLCIIWGETYPYWNWTSIPESRFSQVAKLNYVWWLEVKGSLGSKLLSPRTSYAVFFIFKFERRNKGFADRYVELSVNYEGSNNGSHRRVILDPLGNGVQQREDGWIEVEMGDFFNENEDDGLVEYRLWETDGHYTKQGLLVEGVEFRPKSNE